jgi:hypothetical protein
VALDFPDAPVDGQLYNGFVWDDTYSVWRVRGTVENLAGVSGVTGTVATTTDGDATIYTFTGNGTITVDVAGIADVLLVAGGGAGGGAANNNTGGGGGGGGGVLSGTVFIPAGGHSVTVGAGGVAGGRGLSAVNGASSGQFCCAWWWRWRLV